MFCIMDYSTAAFASTGSTALACGAGGGIGATEGGGTTSGAS